MGSFDTRRADKVVDGNTAFAMLNVMRIECNFAAVEVHRQIRVMIGTVRDCSDYVNEHDRLKIVTEAKRLDDFAVLQRPIWQHNQLRVNLRGCKRLRIMLRCSLHRGESSDCLNPENGSAHAAVPGSGGVGSGCACKCAMRIIAGGCEWW